MDESEMTIAEIILRPLIGETADIAFSAVPASIISKERLKDLCSQFDRNRVVSVIFYSQNPRGFHRIYLAVRSKAE